MKITRVYLMLLVFLIASFAALQAQAKIGYINSEAIIKQLPDAIDAQKQLDGFVAEWQAELSKMQSEWQKSFDEYEKKKLVMTESRRSDRERELREMDQKIASFRTQKFGQNGELFQKQNELMKPVQDRIFKAIRDVATEEGFDYVFDKSGQILLMYTNEKFDLTTKVLEKLKTPSSSRQTR